MAVEGSLKSADRWGLLGSDEEDYTDEKFSQFLKKTKENLSKLTLDKEYSETADENEGDREFTKFLGILKNGFSTNSERSQTSPVAKCSSPYQSNRSHSVSSVISEDSLNSQTSGKKRSFSTPHLSSLHKVEEESRKVFSKDRAEAAEKLYKYFNDKIFDNKLPQDLELVWSADLRTTAGKTSAKRKENVYYSCKIILAIKILTTFERLRDTLLHEMCHAAVWMISQVSGDCHGPLWHTWAARCNMILPDIDVPTRCHNYEISYPFYYKCNNCSWKMGRYRRSAKLSKALCPKCRSSLSLTKS